MNKVVTLDGLDIYQKNFQQILIRGDGRENFNKIIRTIVGNSCTRANDDTVEVDTVLGLPGMSHFIISMDINGVKAPSPVNIMCAAISFCFLTVFQSIVAKEMSFFSFLIFWNFF